MRCPYCGGVNTDRATFCTYCGRDMNLPTSNQPTPRQQPPQPPYQQPPRQAPPQPDQSYPPPVRPSQTPYSAPGRPGSTSVPPQAAQTAQTRPTAYGSPQTRIVPPQSQIQTPVEPPAPDPPAPFPPHTPEELHALESGALSYHVVDAAAQIGRKKVVNIIYPRCAAWQQVATLLKVLKEQQEAQFDTIVVLGYWRQDPEVITTGTFTNGHLIYDRNVRLGSQIQNRYQIDTGNGFDSGAIRIVLSE
jgi:hypothetical protein